MEIKTYRKQGGGYISIWTHAAMGGKAISNISPEQAERNSLRQAKRKGADMKDYNGNPQGHLISRHLDKEPMQD